MPKLKQKAGITSKLVRVFIQDSTSTTGAGLTGLLYNAAGLLAYYLLEGASVPVQITLTTATLGTWTSGGLVAAGSTMPGVYEIGLPNAAVTGAQSVLLMLYGATNMVPSLSEIELDAVNYQSATAFVSSVPSVVGGVTVTTNNDKTGYSLSVTPPTAAQVRTEMDSNSTKLANLDATISSRSTFAGGAVASVTGAVGSIASGGITAASIASSALTAAKFANDSITASALAADAVTKINTAPMGILGTITDTAANSTLYGQLQGVIAGLGTVTADEETVYGIITAIQAKTDNLPASPAATGDAMTLTGPVELPDPAPSGYGGSGGGGSFTSDDRTALGAIQVKTALLSTDMNNPPAKKTDVKITVGVSESE